MEYGVFGIFARLQTELMNLPRKTILLTGKALSDLPDGCTPDGTMKPTEMRVATLTILKTERVRTTTMVNQKKRLLYFESQMLWNLLTHSIVDRMGYCPRDAQLVLFRRFEFLLQPPAALMAADFPQVARGQSDSKILH